MAMGKIELCWTVALFLVLMSGWRRVEASGSCKSNLDLVLVVEDTNGIKDTYNEYTLKGFLTDLVAPFQVSKDNAHVAMQLYNDQSSAVFNLNKIKQNADLTAAILLSSFSHRASPAVIDSALKYTWDSMLTTANGERSCQPTVVVLLSYSSIDDPNGKSNDVYMSKQLRNAGALVLTIGIGPNRDAEHLIALAGDDSKYFDFRDFNQLNTSAASKIATQICSYTPLQDTFFPCPLDSVQTDVVFVLDVSTGLNADLTQSVVGFMNNYLRPFQFGKNGLQAAVVTYADVADVTMSFAASKSLTSFMSSVQAIFKNGPYGDGRDITDALEKTFYHVLIDGTGYRPNALQTVFIFSSNCFDSTDPTSIANALRTNKSADIHVFSLSHGGGFWKEYLDLAGDAQHLHNIGPNPEIIMTNYFPQTAWRDICVRDNQKRKDDALKTTTTTAAPPAPPTITSTSAPPPVPTSESLPPPAPESSVDTSANTEGARSTNADTTPRPSQGTTTGAPRTTTEEAPVDTSTPDSSLSTVEP